MVEYHIHCQLFGEQKQDSNEQTTTKKQKRKDNNNKKAFWARAMLPCWLEADSRGFTLWLEQWDRDGTSILKHAKKILATCPKTKHQNRKNGIRASVGTVQSISTFAQHFYEHFGKHERSPTLHCSHQPFVCENNTLENLKGKVQTEKALWVSEQDDYVTQW